MNNINNVAFRAVKKTDIDSNYSLFCIDELKTTQGNYFSKEYINGYLDELFFIGAFIDEKMIGAVFGEKLKSQGFMISTVVVDNDYRSFGIGSKLLNIIEKNAYNSGAKWCILYAVCKNPKTLSFYKKFGYNIGSHIIECAKDL